MCVDAGDVVVVDDVSDCVAGAGDILVEVILETLDGSPNLTCVQIVHLELRPHVGELIVRHLVVEENIEESLPDHIGVGLTHPKTKHFRFSGTL